MSRILVHRLSNAAFNNVIRRINNAAIDYGLGGEIRPSMIIVSPPNYSYPPELIEYSVAAMAKYFDEYLKERSCLSFRAGRRATADYILFFTTSTSAGSSAFKELCSNYDVFISDEATQSAENEGVIPLNFTRTRIGPSGCSTCWLVIISSWHLFSMYLII